MIGSDPRSWSDPSEGFCPGSRAATRRTPLHMRAGQRVPRVARARAQLLVRILPQVALLGPETTSDDRPVGDYARRRPAAAAFEQLGRPRSSCSNAACVVMLHTHSSVSSRWQSRLRPAGLSALPPASCQEPAACDTGVAGPGWSTSSPDQGPAAQCHCA